jgi:DNA-binding transcriptional MocR family regulator
MTELQGPEQVLYDLLAQHESLGPKQAADALGWNKDQVAQAKEGLKVKGLISTRQGGGMQVAQANGQQASKPLSLQTSEPLASLPLGQKLRCSEANRPLSLQASKPIGQPASKPISRTAYKPMAQPPSPRLRWTRQAQGRQAKDLVASERNIHVPDSVNELGATLSRR